MRMKVWFVGLVAALVSALAWAQVQAPHIASTDWLAQHLTDENQQIIDMRDKIQDYWAGHVPGAQYLNQEALRWPEWGVPGKLMPCDELAKLFTAMGVTTDGNVIIYAEESNFKPTYLAWALDYLGHKQWVIVDGGFKKWKAEGRPITQVYPRITPCPCFTYIGPNRGMRALTADVLARRVGDVLLDVRPKKAYTGEEGFFIRNGHIPGALSHPWNEDLKEDGTWKSAADLLAAYQAQGVTPDKAIITSCGQGLMSAHTYVTLKHVLGFPNVSNYDGGFSEWSGNSSLPVKTGEQP